MFVCDHHLYCPHCGDKLPYTHRNTEHNMDIDKTSLLVALCFMMTPQSPSIAQNPKQEEFKMEPRISAVTLGVSDLDRSYRFYKEGLGLPTKMTSDGGIVIFAIGDRFAMYLH